MDLEKIRELLKIVAESGLAEVEMEIGDDQIKLVVRRNASAPPGATPATIVKTPPALAVPEARSETTLNEPEEPLSPTTEGTIVTAPLVGTLSVELQVVETDPGLKGDTATGATKPATLESGAIVYVPLFVDEGDVIRVNTDTGDYITRVST